MVSFIVWHFVNLMVNHTMLAMWARKVSINMFDVPRFQFQMICDCMLCFVSTIISSLSSLKLTNYSFVHDVFVL